MTAALEEGEWSAARLGRTLPPGKTRYPIYTRFGGPQGLSGRAENLVPTGIRSRTLQPVVSRYTDWATRPTKSRTYLGRNWRKVFEFCSVLSIGINSSLKVELKLSPTLTSSSNIWRTKSFFPFMHTSSRHSWRMKDQLDVTGYFISLLMCSTYFGH